MSQPLLQVRSLLSLAVEVIGDTNARASDTAGAFPSCMRELVPSCMHNKMLICLGIFVSTHLSFTACLCDVSIE